MTRHEMIEAARAEAKAQIAEHEAQIRALIAEKQGLHVRIDEIGGQFGDGLFAQRVKAKDAAIARIKALGKSTFVRARRRPTEVWELWRVASNGHSRGSVETPGGSVYSLPRSLSSIEIHPEDQHLILCLPTPRK